MSKKLCSVSERSNLIVL